MRDIDGKILFSSDVDVIILDLVLQKNAFSFFLVLETMF